jgi:hypothetical protein
VYRFNQFLRALTARFDEDTVGELAGFLTPAQQNLFHRMAPNDQRHSIRVFLTVRHAEVNNADLLVASLLHDVGKSAGRIWLWQRALIVLLERWLPTQLAWLERGSCISAVPWWRKGFVVNRLHPTLGARWAREAGCSSVTVDLIRRHQEPLMLVKDERDRLLAVLQWADGVN